MAVQKSKKSRARRGTRRSHNQLARPALSEEAHSGEVHRRHHLSRDGFYRQQLMVQRPQKKEQTEEGESES